MPEWRLCAFADEAATSLEDQLAVLGDHGIEYIELRNVWGTNVVDLDAAQLRRARRLLRGAAISVAAVASPVGKADADHPREQEMERFRRALNAAEELGSDLVRVFSFYVHGRYDAHREEVLDRLRTMAREAQRRGVTLVLENEAYLYGDVPERCREIVESAASPALGVAFDPANYVLAGVDPLERAWPLLADHVRHVHVKDALPLEPEYAAAYPRPAPTAAIMSRIRPAGKGEAGLAELLHRLAGRRYDGFLTVEPHLGEYVQGSPRERFGIAVAAVRNLVADA